MSFWQPSDCVDLFVIGCWLGDRKGIQPVKVLPEQFPKLLLRTGEMQSNSGKYWPVKNQVCVIY